MNVTTLIEALFEIGDESLTEKDRDAIADVMFASCMLDEVEAVRLPVWVETEAEPAFRQLATSLWKLGENRARVAARPLPAERGEHLLQIVCCFVNDLQTPVRMPTETRHMLQDELRQNFTVADTEAVQFCDQKGELLCENLQQAIRDMLREAIWNSRVRDVLRKSRYLDGQHRRTALSHKR